MDLKLRTYLAELLGTFALVFVGAGTVCATFLTSLPGMDVTSIALAEGFTLGVVLTVTSFLSVGCLNPAITLTLWVAKRLEGRQALGLVAAQLIGGALAALALRLLFAEEILREARFGTPHLKSLLGPDGRVTLGSLASGVGVEACLAFLVTCAAFATLFDRRGPRMGGVAVGLAQSAAILFGFRLTGGAANPARWFGPALWQLTVPNPGSPAPLADHTVYWLGPVLGALVAGLFYSTVILPPDSWGGPEARR